MKQFKNNLMTLGYVQFSIQSALVVKADNNRVLSTDIARFWFPAGPDIAHIYHQLPYPMKSVRSWYAVYLGWPFKPPANA